MSETAVVVTVVAVILAVFIAVLTALAVVVANDTQTRLRWARLKLERYRREVPIMELTVKALEERLAMEREIEQRRKSGV